MTDEKDTTISISSVYARGLKRWLAKRTWIRSNFLLIVLILVFVLCVLALKMNYRYGSELGEPTYGILRDVITSVLISDTVGIFYELFARKSVTREIIKVVRQQLRSEFSSLEAIARTLGGNQQMSACGVMDVWPSRKFLYQDLESTTSAVTDVRVLAIHGTRLWVNKDFQNLILHNPKAQIRVLLLTPDSKYITSRVDEDPEDYDQKAIESQIISSIRLLQKWRAKKGSKCQVRLYDNSPSFTLIFLDNLLYLSAYRRGKSSQDSEVLKIINEERSIFHMFNEYFERMWQEGQEFIDS